MGVLHNWSEGFGFFFVGDSLCVLPVGVKIFFFLFLFMFLRDKKLQHKNKAQTY